MKLDDSTEVTLDLKTIAIIVSFVGSVVGMWFALQGEIEELERQLAETRKEMAGYLEELGLETEVR